MWKNVNQLKSKMTSKTIEGRAPSGVEMIHTPIRFRNLKAEEIECRPQSVVQRGDKQFAKALLYQDARAGMRLLDETVSPMKWQRVHQEIKGNLFCGVGIQQPCGDWVWKWDCGTESNTEQEKGEASDAFKRACVNWGIGRELYEAPSIDIELRDSDFFKGKLAQTFVVKEIETNSKKEITYLVIADKWGKERFTWGTKRKPLTEKQRVEVLKRLSQGEDIWQQLRDSFTFDEDTLKAELEELLKAEGQRA